MPRHPLKRVEMSATAQYSEPFGTIEADYRVPIPLSYCPPSKWEEKFFPSETESFFYIPSAAPQVLVDAPGLLPAQDELAELHRLKQGLRPERMDEIHDQHSDILHCFWRLLKINRTTHSHTFSLIEGIFHDAFVSSRRHKLAFNRPRPYQFDATLEPCFCPGHPSYPGGHATQAFAVALGLHLVIPARHDALSQEALKLATRIAFNREIAGIHFPSDTQAGVELAHELHRLSLTNRLFLELVGLAKAQWDAH